MISKGNRDVRNDVWRTGCIAALTMTGLVAIAVPASASTPNPESGKAHTLTHQSPPPSCVSVRQDPRGIHTWTFHIDNGCPIAQRVKIDLSFRPDSECLTVPAESTADWKGEIGLANQFQGLVAC